MTLQYNEYNNDDENNYNHVWCIYNYNHNYGLFNDCMNHSYGNNDDDVIHNYYDEHYAMTGNH